MILLDLVCHVDCPAVSHLHQAALLLLVAPSYPCLQRFILRTEFSRSSPSTSTRDMVNSKSNNAKARYYTMSHWCLESANIWGGHGTDGFEWSVKLAVLLLFGIKQPIPVIQSKSYRSCRYRSHPSDDLYLSQPQGIST